MRPCLEARRTPPLLPWTRSRSPIWRASLGDPAIQHRDWAGLVWFLGGQTALALADSLAVSVLSTEVEAPPTTLAMVELVPATKAFPATRLVPSVPSSPADLLTPASVPRQQLVPATPIEPPRIHHEERPFDFTTSIALLDKGSGSEVPRHPEPLARNMIGAPSMPSLAARSAKRSTTCLARKESR